MVHTSSIEISESALRSNIRYIREMLGSDTRLSSVIKGNAYGHGIAEFLPLAERAGVDHFSVFSATEAYKALEARTTDSHIMIMGMIDRSDLKWAIENDVSFFVFERGRLEDAIAVAKKLKRPARIHVEFDTGMNRTGFAKKDLPTVAALIRANAEHLKVDGFCTHYAGAESIANHVRVKHQIKAFHNFDKKLVNQGVMPELRHTSCSAAATSYPQTRMDLARIGIMQYGFWPSRETFIGHVTMKDEKVDPLKRVISWKSRIMSKHQVKAGEFIGYGNSYMAESDTEIAIIPVGYAHGYSRSLSNQGRILINGQRVSVIGMVNMNMLIVEITYLKNAQVGDEAVLIGQQGDLEVSVASFGELSVQLNYELLTRLPQDIPRTITE